MRRAGIVLAALGAYLLVALAAWWHVWTGGVAHTLAFGGYGDPAQQVWYLAWLPHALASGLNPFVSHAMFAPKGINLVANSSILLPAFVLSPVTALFGPVVAFNVAVVLAPSLSAFAAFTVFRRYTSFAFGAFLGGLFYGYSPFVLNDLGAGHLHVTCLVFPPLILALLDDLLVARRGSAVGRGALLGLCVAGQFLTSLEVLAMVTALSVVAVVVLAIANRAEVVPRLRRVLVGGAAAAVVAGAILAWPVDVLFFGPRRYHGSVFVSPQSFVVWLKALAWPRGGAPPQLWPAYVGIPLLVIFLVACIRLRRGVLQLSLVLAAVALILAMGRSLKVTPHLGTGIPMPDRLITSAPFLENLLPVRFVLMVDLFVGLGLAVALGAVRDRLTASGGEAAAHRRRPPGRLGAVGALGTRSWSLTAASVVAGAIGVLALVSPFLGAPWPYPTRQVAIPAVYRSPAITGLRPASVLLGYPTANGFSGDALIWQAAEAMPYEMVAGYGFIPSTGPRPIGSLPASPITNLFGDAQIGLLGTSIPARQADAVKAQLRQLEVSDIVVLNTGKQPRHLVGVLTAITGRRPVVIDGAWVWLGLRGGQDPLGLRTP